MLESGAENMSYFGGGGEGVYELCLSNINLNISIKTLKKY
jgi:hypothetical protein